MTQRGPYLSFSRPPMIMVMKPTALAVENTEAIALASTPSSVAMGADRLLQAYMEPTHRLMRQLAIRMTQRFFVSAAVCSGVIPIEETLLFCIRIKNHNDTYTIAFCD